MEEIIDLETIIDNVKEDLEYKYDLLRPVTYEQVKDDLRYRKEVKSVAEAESFNYHSDYWGTAEYYREQNVLAMEELAEVIGQVVDYAGVKLKVISLLIDRQYNSIGHSEILVEEISE